MARGADGHFLTRAFVTGKIAHAANTHICVRTAASEPSEKPASVRRRYIVASLTARPTRITPKTALSTRHTLGLDRGRDRAPAP